MSDWDQILRESSSDRRFDPMKAVPGSHGQPRATYHNPKTGQEFILPADAYNISHYMGRGLRLGSAPDALQQAWLNRNLSSDERPEFAPEVLAEMGSQATGPSENLGALVIALQQQVARLLARLSSNVAGPAVEETTVEPVQLRLL